VKWLIFEDSHLIPSIIKENVQPTRSLPVSHWRPHTRQGTAVLWQANRLVIVWEIDWKREIVSRIFEYWTVIHRR
jgi:hypothetical protein